MATVTVCIYYWWPAPWPCVCSGGTEQERNQVIYCTMPEAHLTHPTSFIALLLHFFHYCYRHPFQYLWLGVTVPAEFTLWPHGEPLLTTTSSLLHTLTQSLPMPSCFSPLSLNTSPTLLFFFHPSLLWSYFSPLWRTAITICLGNPPLPFTSVKLLQGVICWIRKGCFATNIYSVFDSRVIF